MPISITKGPGENTTLQEGSQRIVIVPVRKFGENKIHQYQVYRQLLMTNGSARSTTTLGAMRTKAAAIKLGKDSIRRGRTNAFVSKSFRQRKGL